MSKCIEILSNRNYTLVNESNNYILMKDQNNNHILVFNCNDNLTIQYMKIYMKTMIDNDINHCIIIYKDKITPSAKKIINISELEIEVFTNIEMSINITKHKYYSPHIKLNDNEKKQLLNKYGNHLPIILKSDPVVRYLNFKKGDVLKIIRKNDYIHYRLVK